jgi:hypothetical protein
MPTRRKLIPILAALLVSGLLLAQTTLPPDIVRKVTGNLVLTSRGLALVDAATLELVDVSGVLTLRAVAPPAAINEETVVIKPTAAGATALTIPRASYVAASLRAYRNGMLLARTDDYSVVGTTITLVTAMAAQAGDIYQLSYRF